VVRIKLTTAVLAMAAVLGIGPADAASLPQRIVSLNVCADDLVLALADPDQIAALSIYAADPSLSYLAAQAAPFRHDTESAEQVVAAKPDLILAGTFTKRATRDILTGLGYPLTLMPPANTVDQSIQQIRQVAALVGHPDRGEALVSAIEAARTRAKGIVAGTKLTAADYERRGYVTGSQSLTSDLLTTVGLTDASGGLAGTFGGYVPLEKIVANPPDVIVVDAADPRAEDQGTALLSHPALAEIYPPDRRIVLPDQLITCGGPSLPAAFDRLAAEAERVARAKP
jgi:iron complex transport system substrate-binding protein